ncbi:MAG: CDP-6-deoxy-delta-3,4-glucoseen reductase [Gammaproteobacteria bacterium]|nr:CDP-6-deoxy-delta-3,4-glucoseen reductase [Gammaproteobacteria bacterium]
MFFKVTIQPSGHVFEVGEQESILDAAMRQGIDLPYGCRNGVCGSCAGTVVRGQVNYPRQPAVVHAALEAQNKALFCMAMPKSDLVIRIDERDNQALPVRKFRCRVEEKHKLSHDVMLLKIKLAGDERLHYHAGQYVEFVMDDGRRRAFSIANAPHADQLLELHVRHVNGGFFTDYLFDGMPDKSMMRMEGPLGNFYLRENSLRPIILMGGGTGFGPLKAIVEHVIHVGIKRPVHLFMGVRALRDLYMQELVEGWVKQFPQISFTPVLSEPQVTDNWQGEIGFVHQAVLRRYTDLSPFDIYISGPPPMVNAAANDFVLQGALREHMFSDAFTYSADAIRAIEQAAKK